MARAVVIGGGLIGCACALRLAERGFTVEVVERGEIGELAASAAAAGILGAQLESSPLPALSEICLASRASYPAFVRELEQRSGHALELRLCGALRLAHDQAQLERLGEVVERQRRAGLDATLLDAATLAQLEPALAPVAGAARFGGDGVVDPRPLLQAARIAAERAGASFRRGEVVARKGGAVALADGAELVADEVVIAAGSWSGALWPLPPVTPVRGQLFELRLPRAPIGHVIEGDACYLSPRADGRVLCGSTEERVGFERAVTVEAAGRLLSAAVKLVPDLAPAHLTGSWCGFRAATPDGLPILCRVEPGLVLATGHFRNGIVLAPLTAEIVAALCSGEPPPVALEPFDVRRF